MKFIIHRSQASLVDLQSKALVEQLTAKFKVENHDYKVVAIDADISQLKPADYNVQDNKTHVVLLAGKRDFALTDHFKALKTPPNVVWTGSNIPEIALKVDSTLPDVCIVPKWLIAPDVARSLANKTNLISADTLCYNISDLALSRSKAQLQELRPLPDVSKKSLAVIQLGGDVKNSAGVLVKQFTIAQAMLLAKSVAKNIYMSKLNLENILVVVASSLTTGLYDDKGNKLKSDPHVGGIDKVTMEFMKQLTQELVKLNIDKETIIGIPALIDRLEPSLALLDITTKAQQSLYFVPSTKTELVLQSTLSSLKGVEVICYGDDQSPESTAMQLGGFVSTMSYDGIFKKSLAIDGVKQDLQNSMTSIISNLFKNLISKPIELIVIPDPELSSFSKVSNLLDGYEGDVDESGCARIEKLACELKLPKHVTWQENEAEHGKVVASAQVNNNYEINKKSSWRRVTAAAENTDWKFWAAISAAAVGVIAIASIIIPKGK